MENLEFESDTVRAGRDQRVNRLRAMMMLAIAGGICTEPRIPVSSNRPGSRWILRCPVVVGCFLCLRALGQFRAFPSRLALGIG